MLLDLGGVTGATICVRLFRATNTFIQTEPRFSLISSFRFKCKVFPWWHRHSWESLHVVFGVDFTGGCRRPNRCLGLEGGEGCGPPEDA